MDRSSSSTGAGSRGTGARGGRRRQRERFGERHSTASESAHVRRGDGEEAGADADADAPLAWSALGLSGALLEAVRALGYRQPTPIQTRAIPLALDGRDLVAMARTGSGKTAGICSSCLSYDCY